MNGFDHYRRRCRRHRNRRHHRHRHHYRHHHNYVLEPSIFSTLSLGWTFAHLKTIHIIIYPYPGCKPSKLMNSSFTHAPLVFLPLPLHLTSSAVLSISTGRHPISQSLMLYMPAPLTIPVCHTPPPQPHSENPKRLYKSFNYLFFNDTPHIHLPIIPSTLSRADFQSSPLMFQATHVSVRYVTVMLTHWRHKILYIFPVMEHDALRNVNIGDSSLTKAQAHLTLSLAVPDTTPPAPIMFPKSACTKNVP